jgi:mono/diheme cytochrome c family protein
MKLHATIPSLFLSITLAAGLSAGLAACSADGDPAPDNSVMPADPPPGTPIVINYAVDYHRDAKALLNRYCVGCHQDGGIAPFGLTDYAQAKAQADQIQTAVTTGSMPPWMPADTGVALNHARKLRPEDKAVLLAWISQGAHEGDPAAASRVVLPPEDKVVPPRPDIVADMGLTYQPNTKLTDDYRCFIIDPGLTADRYVRAADVHPGNARIVHHVILSEVPVGDAAKIRAKDTAEPGPGYTCFGGPGSNNAQMLIGWAPGGVASRLRDDEGILVHKGSLLVMQVHYNNRQSNGVGDRSVATLELLADKPTHQIILVPVARPDQLKIAAGDPNAQQVISVPVSLLMGYLKLTGSELLLSGISPHMHTMGKRIATSVSDGPMLLELPHWDFHWQQGYQFTSPVSLRPTDTIVVECSWDNSYANQPVIDGQKQMPHDISWGEGTADEMCISFLHVRISLAP